MIKTFSKILLAIAILWTLAFVFKLGNSFAASTKSEIYEGCYEDGESSLGKKRAKQYCECTSTMISERFPKDLLEGIAGRANPSEIDENFGPAVKHCNINPLAFQSTKLKLSGSNLLRLECTPNSLAATRIVVIDVIKNIATVNNKLVFFRGDSESYFVQYLNDDFNYDISINIIRKNTSYANAGQFFESWGPWDRKSEGSMQIFGYEGICKVSDQVF